MRDGSTPAPNSATRLHQAGVIFDAIARRAYSAQRIGILLVGAADEDDRDFAAFQIAIEALTGEIGLLADLGAKRCGGLTHNGCDMAEWLLPPSFKVVEASGEQQ